MPPKIVPVSTLDWPSSSLPRATVQRAGNSFLNYEARSKGWLKGASTAEKGVSSDGAAIGVSGEAAKAKEMKAQDLFALSEEELSELSYYEVLGNVPMHSTPETIKKYYRKACLRYHPDKTGRGEDDAVFLSVKAAFDTLSDPAKKKSYDSTVDFDDSIPKGDEGPEEFYDTYGPVFERNLRFDRRYDPTQAKDDGGGGKKKKAGKRSKNRRGSNVDDEDGGPPDLGDDGTPIDRVHAFYDYWTHFESWRDFTLKATKMTEHDVDMADSRDEKRWMAKEIDRKAKAMKREEVARITLLVERAMNADPRLKREREREREEKRLAAEERHRKKEEEEKRKAEERARKEKEEAETEARLKAEKAAAKKKKEQEKKQLRKAKQLLWRLALAAHNKAGTTGEDKVWADIETMHDDVDIICDNLKADEILSLADRLGGLDAEDDVSKVVVSGLLEVKSRGDTIRGVTIKEKNKAKEQREKGRAAAAKKEAAAKAARASRAWTKEELSALAKGVKKYPPGGANRWDAIALFVNNLCKPEEPRTKEECIEKYNLIAQGATASAASGGASVSSDADSSAKKKGGDSSVSATSAWTEEEDKLLQSGLAKFPASMDKNERWTAIAKGVPNRSKKECVQRFKAIREALKKK